MDKTRAFYNMIPTLGISLFIPIYFEDVLSLLVVYTGLGWVINTIILRTITAFFFGIFIYCFLNLLFVNKNFKFGLVVVLGMLPGYGVSLINPIHNTDYGLVNSEIALQNIEELEEATGAIFPEKQHFILAFMTSSCHHCQEACRRLGTNKQAGQEIPVHMIFPGSMEDAQEFLKENNGEGIFYHLLDDDDLFRRSCEKIYPSIYLMNGKNETDYHWSGAEMNFSALDYISEIRFN